MQGLVVLWVIYNIYLSLYTPPPSERCSLFCAELLVRQSIEKLYTTPFVLISNLPSPSDYSPS